MSNFVNEFAWFYKRRGARVDDIGVLWADVMTEVGAAHGWRLQDGDYSDSVGAKNLSATGTVGSAAGPGGVGTAATMDGGAGNYLSASDAGLPDGTEARSFSFWFRWTSGTGDAAYKWILSYGTASFNQLVCLGLSNATAPTLPKLILTQYGASVAGATGVTADIWHHAAFTFNNTTADWNVYLDGVLDGTGALTTGTVLGGAFVIGPGVGIGSGMAGARCDVVAAPVEWDQTAVDALRNGGIRLS